MDEERATKKIHVIHDEITGIATTIVNLQRKQKLLNINKIISRYSKKNSENTEKLQAILYIIIFH